MFTSSVIACGMVSFSFTALADWLNQRPTYPSKQSPLYFLRFQPTMGFLFIILPLFFGGGGGDPEQLPLTDLLVERVLIGGSLHWPPPYWSEILHLSAIRMCAAPVLANLRVPRIGETRTPRCRPIGPVGQGLFGPISDSFGQGRRRRMKRSKGRATSRRRVATGCGRTKNVS